MVELATIRDHHHLPKRQQLVDLEEHCVAADQGTRIMQSFLQPRLAPLLRCVAGCASAKLTVSCRYDYRRTSIQHQSSGDAQTVGLEAR
jgi:hypothetical protein